MRDYNGVHLGIPMEMPRAYRERGLGQALPMPLDSAGGRMFAIEPLWGDVQQIQPLDTFQAPEPDPEPECEPGIILPGSRTGLFGAPLFYR